MPDMSRPIWYEGPVNRALSKGAEVFYNVLLFCSPLNPEEQALADDNLRAQGKAARSLGQRSTHSGVPFIQAMGPVRPIALPRNSSAYSHHVPLRRALNDAKRVDFDAKGLGGVSSEAPLALKARALNALTAQDHETLGTARL